MRRSTDVNSVTGLTLHEHNHFTAQIDFVGGTVTVNGAIMDHVGEFSYPNEPRRPVFR